MASGSDPKQQARVTHCLFDMDGLLLNTEDHYTQAQQEVLARYDREFSWELKQNMMGKKAMEAAEWMISKLGLDSRLTPAEFIQQREAICLQLFPTAELMPGAKRLVQHLHAQGVPIAVATSSTTTNFELKTTKHKDFFRLFHHVVTGDQVAKGKPNPEIFLTCAARFNPPCTQLREALVFEDAPSGVAAGKAAGANVVMVPDANLNRSSTMEADQCLNSLADFDPALWGLPPFQS